jgi:hypothetical protein
VGWWLTRNSSGSQVEIETGFAFFFLGNGETWRGTWFRNATKSVKKLAALLRQTMINILENYTLLIFHFYTIFPSYVLPIFRISKYGNCRGKVVLIKYRSTIRFEVTFRLSVELIVNSTREVMSTDLEECARKLCGNFQRLDRWPRKSISSHPNSNSNSERKVESHFANHSNALVAYLKSINFYLYIFLDS